MKTTNRPVYQCEHCKKNYLAKHAAEKHEKYCGSAPENQSKCFNCVFLKESTIRTEDSGDVRSFVCDKLNVGVYPVKVERKGLLKRYPESFKEQIRMPKECATFVYDTNTVLPIQFFEF